MKKICILALLALICLTACTTPAPSGSDITITSTLPQRTPSPAPSPLTSNSIQDVQGGDSGSVELSGGFQKLASYSDYVLLGSCTQNLGLWNSARDPMDITKPSSTVFVQEMQYEFKVERVYQSRRIVKEDGSDALANVLPDEGDIKAGDTIVYTLPYNYKTEEMADFAMEPSFKEPPLDVPMILFLNRDLDFAIYYPEVTPHCFTLADGQVFIFVSSEEIAAKWEQGRGIAGITLEDFLADMGLKS